MPRYRTPRYRNRTVERPSPTFKCRWVPNRSPERKYTGRDAARVMCYALREGFRRADILKQSETICPDEHRKAKQESSAIAEAIAALTSSNFELGAEYQYFLIINGLLTALVAILTFSRFLGPLRIIGLPARVGINTVISQVATQLTRNIVARAANDAAIVALRRAA